MRASGGEIEEVLFHRVFKCANHGIQIPNVKIKAYPRTYSSAAIMPTQPLYK